MTDIPHFLILVAVLITIGFVLYCVYLHKQHIAMTKKLLTPTTVAPTTSTGATTVSGAAQTVPATHKFL